MQVCAAVSEKPPISSQTDAPAFGLRGLDAVGLRDLALDRLRQGLCVFDDEQRLLLFNRRYAEMYSIDPAKLRIGMTLRDVIDMRYAAGTGPSMSPADYAAWRARLNFSDRVTDTEVTLGNGHVHAIHHEPLAGGGYVATFDDITDRHRAEARIRHMAHHDALTGLPNRTTLSERLDDALARLRGEGRLEDVRAATQGADGLAAVLFIDLDHFKDVNDTLGHAAGDLLLRLAAARLQGCLRGEDLLARLGGDEFAVLLETLTDPGQAAEIARRMIEAASVPFALDGHEAVIGASVGIALCRPGEHGVGSDLVLRQADMALYKAKAAGRGAFAFFQAGMSASLRRRKDMERDLRRAVAEGGLDVHFQPIMALSPCRLVGAEALARWTHPEHGVIPPSEFIPVAEQAGIINELGAWVLRAACARAVRWEGLFLAVNLSPEQVRQPGLAEFVESVLAETGLPAARLELEITEGVLLSDTAATLAVLSRLHGLGVRIALDDFGTGFSSLSYLRRFPFDKLKIDRSFIAGMTDGGDAAAIIQTIVTLGRNLSMRVTAEGIETAEQRDYLRAIQCEQGQGYLFGRPGPAAALEALMRSSEPAGPGVPSLLVPA